MNKKADRIKFVNNVINFLIDNGANEIDSPSGRVFVLEGKNTIRFTIEPESEHKLCYSVFGRFEKHNELTGRFNTKCNFHSYSACVVPYLEECIDAVNNMEILPCFNEAV